MNTRLVTTDPDSTVAEALSLMEQNGLHELPVMTNSTLKGWISYRSLLRSGGVAPHVKVASVMETPPRLAKDADVVAAADMMIKSNVRAVPVVDGKGKVVGVLSRTDVLQAASKVPALADQPLRSIMNTELETADEKELVDRAMSRLRSLHINQLLVNDGNGRLRGYVALDDIVKTWSAEHAIATRGHAPPRGGSGQRPLAEVDISSLVHEAPTVGPDARVSDAIKAMTRGRTNFVAVVDDGYAIGVVSRSNIVERLARLGPPEGVLSQIVGLTDHVDSSVLDQIHDVVQGALRKISAELDVEFINLHYKVYKAKAEGDSKFALTVHLSTERKFITQKADAWDAVAAAQAAFEALEKRVANHKELRLEKRKGPPRRAAAFYTAAQSD